MCHFMALALEDAEGDDANRVLDVRLPRGEKATARILHQQDPDNDNITDSSTSMTSTLLILPAPHCHSFSPVTPAHHHHDQNYIKLLYLRNPRNVLFGYKPYVIKYIELYNIDNIEQYILIAWWLSRPLYPGVLFLSEPCGVSQKKTSAAVHKYQAWR